MDSAIEQVVENVWKTYDTNGSGVLEKEEAMKFVKDSLGQMNSGGSAYEYKDSDFAAFFDELDKDHSGSIDKGEMFLFIQKVISGQDVLAAKPKEEVKAASKTILSPEMLSQMAEMDALCPMTPAMKKLAKFLEEQRAKKDKTGPTLLAHVKRVFKVLVKHYPNNALQKLEEVSYLLRNSDTHHIDDFLKIQDLHNYEEVAKSMTDHIARVQALFKQPEPEEEGGEVPEVPAVGQVQDLMADKKLFQWAGVGFGEFETYQLQKSMKALSADNGNINIRLFGKINGTQSDYYIVERQQEAGEEEAADPEAEGEGEPVDKSPAGEGVNKFCYYVAANAFTKWQKLPDVSPVEIDMSRRIQVILTGNLDRDIITNPFFFGKEKNYLRAQIARISHSTTLMPVGQWQLDEENPREIVAREAPDEGELMQAATSAMASPSMWHHGQPNILVNCKTTHPDVEEPADAENFDQEIANKMVEAADPYEPRLKLITEDCKVGLSEKITQASWSLRLMGDSCEYKHDPVDGPQNTPTKSYGVVVVRSLIWPGALTFYYQGQVIQLYCGSGQKWQHGKQFFPVFTPDVCSDPVEYEDGPEPTPLEEPVVEEEKPEFDADGNKIDYDEDGNVVPKEEDE